MVVHGRSSIDVTFMSKHQASREAHEQASRDVSVVWPVQQCGRVHLAVEPREIESGCRCALTKITTNQSAEHHPIFHFVSFILAERVIFATSYLSSEKLTSALNSGSRQASGLARLPPRHIPARTVRNGNHIHSSSRGVSVPATALSAHQVRYNTRYQILVYQSMAGIQVRYHFHS